MINFIKSFFQDRTFGALRSPLWSSFRKEHTKSECEYCGSSLFLNLHHVLPFHLHPELELDTENVVTLCRSCHFNLGHFFKWASFNKDIKKWIYHRQNRPE